MRILLTDDIPFRDGISSLLEVAGFEIVGGCPAMGKKLRPRCVRSRRGSARHFHAHHERRDALRQIKAALPATRVVILTVSESDEDLIEAVQAGRGRLLAEKCGRAGVSENAA